MQQEEPNNLSAEVNALDDYMAELLRDDADRAPAVSAETAASNPPQAPEVPTQAAELNSQKTTAFSLISGEFKPDYMPMLAPNAAAEPYRLPAEAVPADITLSAVQKYSLQKLLDHQMGQPAPPIAPQPETKPELASDPEPVALEAIEEDLFADNADSLDAEAAFDPATAGAMSEERAVEPCEREVAFDEPAFAAPQSQRGHWEGGTPSWASQRFDVLLFSCRKVTLAIPLISLGHIYLERGSLVQMPNLPAWVLGVKASGSGHLKVIDAGAYFMPERAATLNHDDELHIVSIAGSPWAFAVDSVANPIAISKTDVQWRSQNAQSPWLAGAIKREMCVLIDPQALLCELSR